MTTRVTNTPEKDVKHGEEAVTLEFYKGNMVNLERLSYSAAKVLHMQLGDFLSELEETP